MKLSRFVPLLICAEAITLCGIKCLTHIGATAAPLAPSYHATDLGMPSNSYAVYPTALAPGGEVVGKLSLDRGPRAFVWRHGHFTKLTDGVMSAAYGSNGRGTVVGEVVKSQSISLATAWEKGKERRLFDDTAGSVAVAVNRRDDIYGQRVEASTGRWRAFMQDRAGETVYLDGDAAKGSAFVRAVNRRGDVAMIFHPSPQEPLQAVLYRSGKLYPLPAPEAAGAMGLNNRGEVVGFMLREGRFRPALWRNRRAVALPIPREVSGVATDINDRGDVIGFLDSRYKEFGTEAFLIHDGHLFYLDDLIPSVHLERASSLDAAGDMVAWGFNDGHMRGYLLTPQSP